MLSEKYWPVKTCIAYISADKHKIILAVNKHLQQEG